MNLREASDRLNGLLARRWIFVLAVGIPIIVIQGGIEDSPDPEWYFARTIWAGSTIALLAVCVAWIVSGLFEKKGAE